MQSDGTQQHLNMRHLEAQGVQNGKCVIGLNTKKQVHYAGSNLTQKHSDAKDTQNKQAINESSSNKHKHSCIMQQSQ
eukprot:2228799-Alexandrium_andersonii.AAC.1